MIGIRRRVQHLLLLYNTLTSTLYNLSNGQDDNYDIIIAIIDMHVTYKITMKELGSILWRHAQGKWLEGQPMEKWNEGNP